MTTTEHSDLLGPLRELCAKWRSLEYDKPYRGPAYCADELEAVLKRIAESNPPTSGEMAKSIAQDALAATPAAQKTPVGELRAALTFAKEAIEVAQKMHDSAGCIGELCSYPKDLQRIALNEINKALAATSPKGEHGPWQCTQCGLIGYFPKNLAITKEGLFITPDEEKELDEISKRTKFIQSAPPAPSDIPESKRGKLNPAPREKEES